MGIRHLAGVAAITAVLAAQTAPALALGDGPAIASDWIELDVSPDECFARGEAAIRRVGFGEIERTKYSRFGTREDYTVSLRCVAEKKLVLFLASGRERTRAHARQLDVHRITSRARSACLTEMVPAAADVARMGKATCGRIAYAASPPFIVYSCVHCGFVHFRRGASIRISLTKSADPAGTGWGSACLDVHALREQGRR